MRKAGEESRGGGGEGAGEESRGGGGEESRGGEQVRRR